MSEKTKTIRLVSQESDSYEVSLIAAKISELLKNCMDADPQAQEIQLSNIKSSILARIVDYLQHHISEPMFEIEKPLISNNMKDIVQEWYANFVLVDQDVLFDLVLAASFLDIPPLLDLTCATIASTIKGKTSLEIRRQFQIDNFIPEEPQVRGEAKWAEDL
jgi:S-phase kinase-associated protein 1